MGDKVDLTERVLRLLDVRDDGRLSWTAVRATLAVERDELEKAVRRMSPGLVRDSGNHLTITDEGRTVLHG